MNKLVNEYRFHPELFIHPLKVNTYPEKEATTTVTKQTGEGHIMFRASNGHLALYFVLASPRVTICVN